MRDLEEVLADLVSIMQQVERTDGVDGIGAFHPIGETGKSRGYGEFQSLGEYAGAIARVLQDFLDEGCDGADTYTVAE